LSIPITGLPIPAEIMNVSAVWTVVPENNDGPV
jgi:hypothetical protein